MHYSKVERAFSQCFYVSLHEFSTMHSKAALTTRPNRTKLMLRYGATHIYYI